MNETKLFGTTVEAFDLQTLKNNLNNDKANDTTFTNSKQYFLKYFAKSLNDCFYFFEPSENEDDMGEIIKLTNITNTFKHIEKVKYFIDGEDKPRVFDLYQWFMKNHNVTYNIGSDPRKDRFYKSERTKRNFINLSKGFLHKTRKEYDSFPEHVKDKVENVLNHIKNVWNSGNIESYNYTMKWLSHALTGHKMKTALFLKSGEGTGKSIIVEFLIEHVIGRFLGIVTQRASQLMKFNFQLLNKLILCLEELPASGKNEWHTITDYLKDIITNSTMDIEKKYEDVMQILNLISLIIITNNENAIRFGKDIRRYHMCDISHDRVGDTEYFQKLNDCLDRETGEAFFWYLTEMYESNLNFNEAEMPITNQKIAMKELNLTSLLEFIKKNYISAGLGIGHNGKPIPLGELMDAYNSTISNKVKIKQFHNMITADIGVCKIKQYGASKTLHIMPIDFKTLLSFYKKKGYWDDRFDTFDNDNEDTLGNDLDFIATDYIRKSNHDKQINELQNTIKQLQEQIASMKQSQKTEPTKVIELIEDLADIEPTEDIDSILSTISNDTINYKTMISRQNRIIENARKLTSEKKIIKEITLDLI